MDTAKCKHGGAHVFNLETNHLEIGIVADDAVNVHISCNKCGATAFQTFYVNELEWEGGSSWERVS